MFSVFMILPLRGKCAKQKSAVFGEAKLPNPQTMSNLENVGYAPLALSASYYMALQEK
jgi:hypothetical protein